MKAKLATAAITAAVVGGGGWWVWQAGSTAPPVATGPAVAVAATAVANQIGDGTTWKGLSDLALRPGHGRMTVPERQRALLTLDGAPLAITASAPLLGVPADVDVESLAFVGPDRVVLGTERHADLRDSDAVLLADAATALAPAGPDGSAGSGSAGSVSAGTGAVGAWRVAKAIDLPYRLWQLKARDNHGIEGLCALPGGTTVVAAVEHVEQRGSERWAPLAVLDLTTEIWTPYWLRLTSEDGKPSALWCEVGADGKVKLWVLERHYGTSRIVQTELPRDAKPLTVLPLTVWLDLEPNLSFLPNWEGMLRVDDTTFELLSDNASGDVVRGPAYFLRLQRR